MFPDQIADLVRETIGASLIARRGDDYRAP